MPLHLLGKKSWNVYNADNVARVKADEAAAAAREAAHEQRMQELDAERRAAILRGRTPPPLPDGDTHEEEKSRRSDKGRDDRGHDRKRRKLAGEDDTDRDIRLAASITGPRDAGNGDAKVVTLRKPTNDAPLTDHAGNINLFPVDLKEAMKREKNEEAEREKKKKKQAFEDQYTMRFSNAAGNDGLERPWYTASSRQHTQREDEAKNSIGYPEFESKDVWGNEDPLRKEREQARITSNDPFAFMQKAQAQLKKSKEDKKKWAQERDRELRDLKAAQEIEGRRHRHSKRKKHAEDDADQERRHDKHQSSGHRYRHQSRSRDRSREKRHRHRHEPRRKQSIERDCDSDRDNGRRRHSNRTERTSHIDER